MTEIVYTHFIYRPFGGGIICGPCGLMQQISGVDSYDASVKTRLNSSSIRVGPG